MAVYHLPNGKTLTGLPEGITDEKIKQFAITKGYATENDYLLRDYDQQSNADLLSLGSEISGSIVGSIVGGMAAGALAGSVVPGAGTLVGGLVGAAGAIAGGGLGAGTGRFIGEAVEAAAEKRDFNPSVALEDAQEAAIADAAWGLAGAGLGKGFSFIYKGFKNAFVGQKVFDPDAIAKAELQQKLVDRGTSLLPSQLGLKGLTSSAPESYLKASGLSKKIDETYAAQEKYIQDTFEGLFESLPNVDRTSIGNTVVGLIKSTEKALKNEVKPIYKQIEEAGNVKVDLTGLKNIANSVAKKGSEGGVDGSIKVIKKELDNLPNQIELNDARILRGKLDSLIKSSPKNAELIKIDKRLNSLMEADKFVNIKGLDKELFKIMKTIPDEKGKLKFLTPSSAKLHKSVEDTAPTMTFTEAADALSAFKSLKRQLDSADNVDGIAIRGVTHVMKRLEGAMDAAAKNLDDDLGKIYGKVSRTYRRGLSTIHAGYMDKAMNKVDPERVGELLYKTGNVTSIKQVNDLIQFAQSRKYLGRGKATNTEVMKSIRSGYLRSMFDTRDVKSLEQFLADRTKPKFQETFQSVVGKELADSINKLADEVGILVQGTTGKEGAASLYVRGKEFAAIQDPTAFKSLVVAFMPNVFSGAISPGRMTKKANALKKFNQQLEKAEVNPNVKISNTLLKEVFDENWVKAGNAIGQVSSAVVNQVTDI